MGIFKNLNTEGLEQAEDRLGGYSPLETDAYTGEIKMAYAGKSDGGAMKIDTASGNSASPFGSPRRSYAGNPMPLVGSALAAAMPPS